MEFNETHKIQKNLTQNNLYNSNISGFLRGYDALSASKILIYMVLLQKIRQICNSFYDSSLAMTRHANSLNLRLIDTD